MQPGWPGGGAGGAGAGMQHLRAASADLTGGGGVVAKSGGCSWLSSLHGSPVSPATFLSMCAHTSRPLTPSLCAMCPVVLNQLSITCI